MKPFHSFVAIGAGAAVFIALGAIAACQGAPKATPTAYATPTLPPTPTPKPTRSVAEVQSAWQSQPYLASTHLKKGLQCQTCHNPFPPNGAPESKTCLTCHGGSYAAVAALVKSNPNPHQSHLGEIACAECHRGHESFALKCSGCHPEIISTRFP